MFKHYLTYSFALNFVQACRDYQAPHWDGRSAESLNQSATKVLHHFSLALHASRLTDELMHTGVALMCLRDCRVLLDAKAVRQPEIDTRYHVLVSRLEQICLKLSERNGCQLEMIG